MSKYGTQPHWMTFAEVAEQVDLDDPSEHMNALRVIVRALHRQRPSLPDFLVAPLDKAAAFLAGGASAAELEEACVALWRLLRERGDDPNDPVYWPTRAVICALYPPSREAGVPTDFLGWFLECWDMTGYAPEAAAEALRFVYVSRS